MNEPALAVPGRCPALHHGCLPTAARPFYSDVPAS